MFAAKAPERKVGPRLMVMPANQIMEAPTNTHCGDSIMRGIDFWSESSGSSGASFRTFGAEINNDDSLFIVSTGIKYNVK